jgi:hypothetical protein
MVFEDDLKRAFDALRRRMTSEQAELTLRGFRKLLAELVNDFIKVEGDAEQYIIRFHNPSVRDFVGCFLATNHDEASALYEAAVFFEQCVELWIGNRAHPSIRAAIVRRPEIVWESLLRTFDAESCRLASVYNRQGLLVRRTREQIALVERMLFVLEVAQALPNAQATDATNRMLMHTLNGDQRAAGNREGLLAILEQLDHMNWPYVVSRSDFFAATYAMFVQDLNTPGDFIAYLTFKKHFEAFLSEQDDHQVIESLEHFCMHTLETHLFRDPGEVYEWMTQLEEVGAALDVDLQPSLEWLEEEARMLEQTAQSAAADTQSGQLHVEAQGAVEEIDQLFSTLGKSSVVDEAAKALGDA